MKRTLLAMLILPLFAQDAAKLPEVKRPSDASTSTYWKIKSDINDLNVQYLQAMNSMESQLKAAIQSLDADCVKSGTGLDQAALQNKNIACLAKEEKKAAQAKEAKGAK